VARTAEDSMTQPSHLHLVTDAATHVPLPEVPPTWTTGHDVQFYDSDEFLCSSVATFMAEGIRAGQPIVIIATEAHRCEFEARLRAIRVDAGDPTVAEITWLDARDTLAAFMEGNRPNPELFHSTIGRVFDKIMSSRQYLVVRAYGEMVDLLWKDGNVEGAIALEDLWNALSVKYSFNLLCAYAMGNFFKETHSHSFRRICEAHGRAAPTEEYLHAGDGDRLKQITILQQRARALEAEVHHRRDLEAALRETLAHRRRVEEELRRREAALRDGLEHGIEPMHWVGADGIVIWANAAECELLGYTRDEVIGRHIAMFHADAAVIADILTRLSRGEQIRNFQARLKRKDGSIRHVLISSNVFRQDGQFVHTRCFTRDVTEFIGKSPALFS
jgi:PAS domain S-box-containing protein